MPDYVENKDLEIPEEVPNFGDLLRTLRNNHGYSTVSFSKMIGLPPKTISEIELSKRDLPPENVLRNWFHKLGCGVHNTNKLILISRQYRVKHWISLSTKEPCNPDLLRLLAAYRSNSLTDYDRYLLKLVARSKNIPT